jgi:hypothetical protein
MQENSRRTAFGRKGHNDCRSRIVFHATSFNGYGKRGTDWGPGNVRNAYSDETRKSSVRTKPPNYPSLSLRTPIVLLHLCAKESNTVKSTSAFLVLS